MIDKRAKFMLSKNIKFLYFFHNFEIIIIYARAKYYGNIYKYLSLFNYLVICSLLDTLIVHATACYLLRVRTISGIL